MANLTLMAGLLALALFLAVAVQLHRWSSDQAEARRAREELWATSVALPQRYAPSLVADLPEPARRFFNFAIAPGSRWRWC